MRAGRMRHSFTIVAPATAPDSFGQPIQTGSPAGWDAPPAQPNPAAIQAAPTAYGPFWGLVEPVKGDEPAVAEQLRGRVTHKVTMRWCGSIVAISPAMQISFEGRTLNIAQALNILERNREYQLFCTEVVTGTS